jgi:Uma2 family endonuclease
MSVMLTTLDVPFDGWTVDDLPEDVDFRYELVDGSLLVSPPPRPRHQDVSAQLALRISPLLGAEWRCGGPMGVYFDRRNYREPDVAIYRRAALEGERLLAEDVLLAVEVMSPSSVKNDRITKPAQYAAAGIPYFWRLELEPLVLLTYALDGETYRETGRFDDEVVIEGLVALRLRLADLVS